MRTCPLPRGSSSCLRHVSGNSMETAPSWSVRSAAAEGSAPSRSAPSTSALRIGYSPRPTMIGRPTYVSQLGFDSAFASHRPGFRRSGSARAGANLHEAARSALRRPRDHRREEPGVRPIPRTIVPRMQGRSGVRSAREPDPLPRVLSRVEEDVRERGSHLARRAERSVVVAPVEHRTTAAEDPIHGAREAHGAQRRHVAAHADRHQTGMSLGELRPTAMTDPRPLSSLSPGAFPRTTPSRRLLQVELELRSTRHTLDCGYVLVGRQ